jgi:hypothetical protein
MDNVGKDELTLIGKAGKTLEKAGNVGKEGQTMEKADER